MSDTAIPLLRRAVRTALARALRAEKSRDRWMHTWEAFWAKCDDEAKRRAHAAVERTQQWYGVRHERLAQWAREDLPEDLRTQFFNIYANGKKDAYEPPTHTQMFQQMKYRAEKAEKELATIRKRISHRCLTESCAPCERCASDHGWLSDEVHRIDEWIAEALASLPDVGGDYDGREADIKACRNLLRRIEDERTDRIVAFMHREREADGDGA